MAAIRSILGLDVGDRRIGVALANSEVGLASPLMTIDRKIFPDAFGKLAEIIENNQVGAIVIGLPRGMGGQETSQTESARQFADLLAKATGLPVHLQDEAATSILAKEELDSKRRPYEKGDIDKLAATYILTDWLAGRGRELKA